MQYVMKSRSSAVSFQECRNLTEFQHIIDGYNTRLKITRCKFWSLFECVYLTALSSIVVSSSHLQGFKGFALSLVETIGRVTDCTIDTSPDKPDGFFPKVPLESKGLFGAGAVIRLSGRSNLIIRDTDLFASKMLHDNGIKCDLGSVAEFSSSNGRHVITGGDLAGIECNGAGSLVSVINYKVVNSQTDAAVRAVDGGKVVLSRISTVYSATLEAFNLNSGAVLELDSVREIQGLTWGAIVDGGSKLTIRGPTESFKGLGDEAVIAKNGSHVVLEDIAWVFGGTTGVIAESGSQVTIRETPLVQGDADHAVSIKDSNLLAMGGHSSYNPSAAPVLDGKQSAIRAEGTSKMVVLGYSNILGQTDDAIHMENGASLAIRAVTTLQGEKSAVRMGSNCRLEAIGIENVIASSEYGFYGSVGSSARIERITDIDSVLGGIHLVNGAEYLHATTIDHIKAVLGHGIYFNGRFTTLTDITHVESIGGQAHGVVIEKAQGKITNISKIEGFQSGLQIKLGATVEGTDVPHCEGKNSPHGLDVISAVFKAARMNFIKDGLTTGGAVDLLSCTFSGAFVGNDATVKMASCRVDGHFEITDVSYDILNTLMSGSHISIDSSGVSRNYTQGGTYTATNEAAVHTGLNLDSTMTVTTSSIEIHKGTVAGKVTAAQSTFKTQTASLNGGLDCPSSSVEIDRSTVGAVTANNAGLIFRASQVGGMELTDSGLLGVSGSLGAIALTNSSVELYSSSATVTGTTAPGPLVCAPGYVVIAGNGKRYSAFDDEARHWYGKSLKERVNNDYQLNVGNEGGSMEINVFGAIEERSVTHIQRWAPDICDDTSPENKPADPFPKEPQVIG
jgi:hypothetical protein